VQDSKSYYVTISELHKMGNGAYSKRLRVAGNVQPGSIKRTGRTLSCVDGAGSVALGGLHRDGGASGYF